MWMMTWHVLSARPYLGTFTGAGTAILVPANTGAPTLRFMGSADVSAEMSTEDLAGATRKGSAALSAA